MAVQIDGSQGSVIATSGSYSGGVSIGGTLTYEDVTNIDAVGLITARNGIEIGASPGVGASISVDGNAVFSGITTVGGNLNVGAGLDVTGDVTMTNTSSNPQLALISANNGISEIQFGDGADAVRGNIIYRAGSAGDALCFNGYNNTERMRIDSSGRLLSGLTSSVRSTAYLQLKGANTSDIALYWPQDAATAGSSISWLTDGGAEATETARIFCGQTTTGADGGYMTFMTHNGTSVGERLRITSTGVVSINDSTPETFATLQVNNHSTHNAAQVLIRGADQAQIILRDDTGGTDQKCTTIRNDQGNLIFGTHNDAFSSFTERLRIDTDGILSVTGGSNNRAFKVNCTHSSGGEIVCFDNGVNNHYGALIVSAGEIDRECRLEAAYGGGFLTFWTQTSGGAAGERMRITDGGNVTIGKTSALGNGGTAGIELNGSSHYSMFVRGSNVPMYVGRNSTTGTVVSYLYNGTERGKVETDGSVIAYNTSSDYRLKENETTLTNGIEKLKQLKPYTFNFKDTPNKIDQGFFAHEVQTVVPGAVSGTKDAVATEDDSERGIKKGDIDPQQMDYAKLTPLLTAALQEAIAKIEVLESEVAALKSS